MRSHPAFELGRDDAGARGRTGELMLLEPVLEGRLEAAPLGEGDRRRPGRRGRTVGGQDEGLERVEGLGGAGATDGVGPPSGAVGGEQHAAAGRLLDAVMAAAEGEEVARGRGTGRPGPHVVEVAEARRHRTPGEATAPVAGPDEGGELAAGPVGARGEVTGGVEAGAGGG